MSDETEEDMERPRFFKQWLPDQESAIEQWHSKIRAAAKVEGRLLLPVIHEFMDLIHRNPVVRMNLTQMIERIPPECKPYHPTSVTELLQWINVVLTTAPEFNNTQVIGVPLTAVLMWTMTDDVSFAAYRDETINRMFKAILAAWKQFLDSPASRYVLNSSPNGWQCEAAMQQLKMEDYQYDAEAPYWGFDSWNQFFTRQLAPNRRPIAYPTDNKVIVSACDSTVYSIQTDVQRFNQFWLKSQPHSLSDMLGRAQDYVDAFVGGTVYQAFLSPFNYHRWHSPVSGIVTKAFVQEGLYFSQANNEGQDPTVHDHSQGYITQVQTRAVIVIEADDKTVGPVCVIPVGMVEISSCVIDPTIALGSHVEKGQELGYFQYGGSTHCLIFRKGVIKEFMANVNDFKKVGEIIALTN